MLEGHAGSGKTAYCNKLAYDWSRGDYLLSFDYLVLLDMNMIQDSLEDAVYNQLYFYKGLFWHQRVQIRWNYLLTGYIAVFLNLKTH